MHLWQHTWDTHSRVLDHLQSHTALAGMRLATSLHFCHTWLQLIGYTLTGQPLAVAALCPLHGPVVQTSVTELLRQYQ